MKNAASRPRDPRIFLTLLVVLPVAVTALAQSVNPPGSDANAQTQGSDPEDGNSIISKNIDYIRFSQGASAHYYNYLSSEEEPLWVFFPPVPPALESELPLLPPFVSGVAAPPELSAYVGDIFYPMLAARLASDDLPKTMRMELQGYRTTKADLQNELRSKIAAVREFSPEEQVRELAAFAAAQAPRIIALESTAEKIRANLRRTGLFGLKTEDDKWVGTEKTRSSPAKNPEPVNPLKEAKAIRGAAFYLEGLSAVQRRLLLESALELESGSERTGAADAPNQPGWLLYFFPETSRVRLVADLPAPLAQKISEYVAVKQTLKSELRDLLAEHARSSFSRRTAALNELTTNQAIRLAALETLAEAIRRELSGLPTPPGPPGAPSLPPELVSRISIYRTHKVELLKTMYAMLTRTEKDGKGTPADPRKNPRNPSNNPSPWLGDGTTQMRVSPAKLLVPTGEFNSTQLRLLDELNKEQAGIREAMASHFRTTNQPADRKSINDLLKDFETSRQKQEIWDKYRDYQTAVLLPGLSPEQRRLLFSAAVEQLALPLPAGEKVP